MRTIQMTLDDELVETIDRMIKKLGTSRSAFTRSALREAIKRIKTEELEEKHKNGYEKQPVVNSEFSIWEAEQVWGD